MTKPVNIRNNVVSISEDSTAVQIQELLQRLPRTSKQQQLATGKPFNATDYFNTMQWGQDALAFQRELRGDNDL